MEPFKTQPPSDKRLRITCFTHGLPETIDSLDKNNYLKNHVLFKIRRWCTTMLVSKKSLKTKSLYKIGTFLTPARVVAGSRVCAFVFVYLEFVYIEAFFSWTHGRVTVCVCVCVSVSGWRLHRKRAETHLMSSLDGPLPIV